MRKKINIGNKLVKLAIQRTITDNPRFKHLYIRDVGDIIDATLDAIGDALEEGRPVELRGFGQFYLAKSGKTQWRNPRTGAMVDVTTKQYVKFTLNEKRHRKLQEIEFDAGINSVCPSTLPTSPKKTS